MLDVSSLWFVEHMPDCSLCDSESQDVALNVINLWLQSYKYTWPLHYNKTDFPHGLFAVYHYMILWRRLCPLFNLVLFWSFLMSGGTEGSDSAAAHLHSVGWDQLIMLPVITSHNGLEHQRLWPSSYSRPWQTLVSNCYYCEITSYITLIHPCLSLHFCLSNLNFSNKIDCILVSFDCIYAQRQSCVSKEDKLIVFKQT